MNTNALKIEEGSNETASNLMIEDRQNSTTSSTSAVTAATSRYLIIEILVNEDF